MPGQGDREANRIRILFLAAIPAYAERLKLEDAFRAIDRAVRRAAFGERFHLEQRRGG